MLNSVVSFVVALGVLVFIHEYGHYSVARYFKVRVIRFSVGFGKPLFKWVNPKNKVEWTLSWIPLGGFVRMLDERDPESLLGDDINLNDAFNRKPVGQRIAIVLAGPLANLILASVLFAGLAYVQPEGLSTRLAQPTEHSLVAKIGVMQGDEVVQVNGKKTDNWADVSWAFLQAKLFGNDIALTVKREHTEIALTPIKAEQIVADIGPGLPRELGFALYEKRVLVRSISPDSPAASSNFQENDELVSVNGQMVESAAHFTALVQPHPNVLVDFVVRREGNDLQVRAVPMPVKQENGDLIGRMGLGVSGDVEVVNKPLGVFEAFEDGVARMFQVSVFSVVALGKMLTGDLSWQHLSGPVSIASAAGESSSLGILPFLGFLAMVSVSLGVLNLLPIPILDGGHLMYYFAELVSGRPVSEKIQIVGQRLGGAIIAGMTMVALFNDIQRLF